MKTINENQKTIPFLLAILILNDVSAFAAIPKCTETVPLDNPWALAIIGLLFGFYKIFKGKPVHKA